MRTSLSVHGRRTGCSAPCAGIAFDGTGYGADGRVWGGEVLLSQPSRPTSGFANFAYVPMPGGAAAVRNPLRMAYGVLYEFDLLEHPGAADGRCSSSWASQTEVCEQMIERGLNTPYTSSVGRLFDAASALLGVCRQPSYDGQPAIELEAAMGAVPEGLPATDAYHIDVVKNTATETSTALDTSVLLFDAAPAFKALLDDITSGVPVATIARRFHDAFVNAIVMAAQLVQSLYGIDHGRAVGRRVPQPLPARARRCRRWQGNGFTVAHQPRPAAQRRLHLLRAGCGRMALSKTDGRSAAREVAARKALRARSGRDRANVSSWKEEGSECAWLFPRGSRELDGDGMATVDILGVTRERVPRPDAAGGRRRFRARARGLRHRGGRCRSTRRRPSTSSRSSPSLAVRRTARRYGLGTAQSADRLQPRRRAGGRLSHLAPRTKESHHAAPEHTS